MSIATDETWLSWAAVDSDGCVTASCAYAIHSRIAPGGQVIATPQDAADYVASYAPTGPNQTVHIWFGGGVFNPVGTLVDQRTPDATAVVR
jgi:hypothetical protein